MYVVVYLLEDAATAGARHGASVDVCTRILTCIYTHTHMHIYVGVNIVCVCVYGSVCVWMCMCMGVCMCYRAWLQQALGTVRALMTTYLFLYVFTHTDVYKYDCVNVVRVCIWVCVSLDVYILVCT